MSTPKTPAYVFSLPALYERIRFLKERLGPDIRLVYAMKANPFLVHSLVPCADGFEVCSPGEERICRKAGVPGGMMILSGVNKEEHEIAELVRHYRSEAVYTVESYLQAGRLNAAALKEGTRISVLLRLSSGNQFGIDAGAVESILKEKDQYPGLLFKGIHFFSGTQKKMKKIREEIRMLDELLEKLREKYGFAAELEYGPGLPVSYFPAEEGGSEEEILTQLTESLKAMKFRGRLTLEMGRFIAAPCGYYLTKVRDLKENEDAAYCITDGGIHQMNYYGQMMGMKVPSIRRIRLAASGPERGPSPAAGISPSDSQLMECLSSGGAEELPLLSRDPGRVMHWTICGSLCTVGDVLIRDLPVQDLQLGDILVFEKAGAYSVTEGISLFLSRDLPRIYLYDGSDLAMVRDQILTEEWNYGRNTGNT